MVFGKFIGAKLARVSRFCGCFESFGAQRRTVVESTEFFLKIFFPYKPLIINADYSDFFQ